MYQCTVGRTSDRELSADRLVACSSRAVESPRRRYGDGQQACFDLFVAKTASGGFTSANMDIIEDDVAERIKDPKDADAHFVEMFETADQPESGPWDGDVLWGRSMDTGSQASRKGSSTNGSITDGEVEPTLVPRS